MFESRELVPGASQVGGKNVPEAVSWGRRLRLIQNWHIIVHCSGGGFNYFSKFHPGSLGK